MENQNQTPRYKKVLVIDDTYVDRYIAERNIKKYGFAEEVISKESARSALDYLAGLADHPEELPQLIFLDIRMPEVDGFGFLAEYENLPEQVKSNSIVMMLSTSLNPDDHEKAANNKYVSKFLNKPLNQERLEEISQLLSGDSSWKKAG
ncbi:MAG: response regulator [Bacteroidetes bacterium]|nr:response regulator [Bacteroidota bacterium]